MIPRRAVALAACALLPLLQSCESSPSGPDFLPSSTLILRLNGALLAVADAGGSPDTIVISDDGEVVGEHEVSPNGDYVAYLFDAIGAGPTELHVARTDGSSDVTITGFVDSPSGVPSWSPNSQRLVFSVFPRILTVNRDGTGLDTIVDSPEYVGVHPHWSPSGDRITFGGYVVGEETTMKGIWTIRSDGSDARFLTSAEVYTTSSPSRRYPLPRFSPDGGWIVFDDEADLHLVRADGTQRRALTSSPLEDEWYPRWSPDGGRLAIVVDGGARWGIQILNASNGAVVGGVASDEAGDLDVVYPAWSPDGERIAFTVSRLGGGTYREPTFEWYAIAESDLQTDWADPSAPDLRDGAFPEWWPNH